MAGEPKVIYVKMVYRPARSSAQALRKIFNTSLEEQVAKFDNCYLIDIHVQSSLFDLGNGFSSSGKHQYWEELDSKVKLFDSHPDKFKPERLSASTSASCTLPCDHYRLPPPPTTATTSRRDHHSSSSRSHQKMSGHGHCH